MTPQPASKACSKPNYALATLQTLGARVRLEIAFRRALVEEARVGRPHTLCKAAGVRISDLRRWQRLVDAGGEPAPSENERWISHR